MADKFLQQDGIEVGYFSKRKGQFIDEISKGLKSATSQPATVRQKPKKKTDSKKTEKTEKPEAKKDLSNVPPNQLKGQDFVERMRLAREAKAKNSDA